jgi:hypothetical protein
MRGARWGEALYGVPALFFAMALPTTPEGVEWFLWAHWLGTAVAAFALAWRLRRPTRATWYAAALLSAYVLAYSALAVPRWLSALTAGAEHQPAVSISAAMWSCTWVGQLIVAASCARHRRLRAEGRDPVGAQHAAT